MRHQHISFGEEEAHKAALERGLAKMVPGFAWGEHIARDRPQGGRIPHYDAWDATVTALVAYQKHLDSVAPAKTTTRMMMLSCPGPIAEIHFGVSGIWSTTWPVGLRKGDRLIISYSGQVLVDLERPYEVAPTPADRDFFVSG